jgi:hypothetical protein
MTLGPSPGQTPPRRYRRLGLALAATAATGSTLSQTACTTVVTPPDAASLRDPVVVYLIDYHRHSALILPTPQGGLREYAYGEWGWFAENRTGWFRAPGVLLVPGGGALGRADWPTPDDAESLREQGRFQAVFELTVERDHAAALLGELDARFESRRGTMVRNHAVGLDLVKDEDDYWLGNHCNHATARWLGELGVRASPVTAVARYRVRKAP